MSAHPLARILLAATASGAGKTTLTCGLLRALSARALRPIAFKCGPDYIDPLFHEKVLGIPSRNLDLFFTDAPRVRTLLAQNAASADLAVIEGVMGYYDGLAGISTTASSYDLARVTDTPVILALDCAGCSVSAAAQVKGFQTFRADSNLAGVLLNRVSAALFPEMKRQIEAETGVRVVGYLPRLPDCSLESRHLGLVLADEVPNLQKKLDRLAAVMAETVDLDAILAIARSAPPLHATPLAVEPVAGSPLIAVARDEAFCFYYQDSLELLTALGARLTTFSPLDDPSLLPDVSGVLLGGGYPELYAQRLTENRSMRDSLRTAIGGHLPCIAECGGFLYLHRRLADASGQWHEMAGVIDADAFPTGKLGRFGYMTLTAQADNLLCAAGESIRAHEFHYWGSSDPGNAFESEKPLRALRAPCVHASPTLYAGFPHLYLHSNERCARAFVTCCAAYAKEHQKP